MRRRRRRRRRRIVCFVYGLAMARLACKPRFVFVRGVSHMVHTFTVDEPLARLMRARLATSSTTATREGPAHSVSLCFFS